MADMSLHFHAGHIHGTENNIITKSYHQRMLFSHAAMTTQRYEQFWYKPIPHDFEKLILSQRSLHDRIR